MSNRFITSAQMPAYDRYTLNDSRYFRQSTIDLIQLKVFEMKQCPIFVDVRTSNSLAELKEKIARYLNIRTSIYKFFLEKFDANQNQWVKIDDSNLFATIDQLGLRSCNTINVEYYKQQISEDQHSLNLTSLSNNNRELTLKLCMEPMNRSNYTFLKTHSLSTLKKLRKQAYEYLNKSYKNQSLFVWNQGYWMKFDSELDDQTLSDLSFESYMLISTDYDENNSNSKLPRGLCGIANLGNTCFMNSVFQCLTNIPEFTEKILALNDEINGPITSEFRRLIKQIWSGTYNYIEPSILLTNINNNLPRYANYRQQDAQEFMDHFLHLIHAELSTKESSLITELFYGKMRSTVKCLGCQRSEITNESISFLPLPISNFNQKTILYIKADGEQCLIPLQINSSVRDIIDLIDCFIKQHDQTLTRERILAIRLVNNSVKEIYDTWKSLTYIHDNELAFVEHPKKFTNQDYIWCNFYDRSTEKPFRPPTVLIGSLYECSYEHLADQIDQLLGHLCSMTGAPVSACALYWIDRYDRQYKLRETPSAYESLRNLKAFIIKMDTEWTDIYKIHYNTNHSIDNSGLHSLLTDFFHEEPLVGDYHCLQCPKLTKARQKSDLCLPLPPVLIIQLKRFSYDSYSSDKIDAFISFPINELDLKEYIIKDDNNNNPEKNSSTKYELVAVSNHTGSLTSGHYTTYAKNIHDQKWYMFDDRDVRKLNNDNDILTKNAYLLVYVQKSNHKR